LKDLESEKAAIENTIRRITSEPFLNSGDQGGGSALKRIADLQDKLI
jgi:hypothetical protein